jgi:enterochelin esterase family protein
MMKMRQMRCVLVAGFVFAASVASPLAQQPPTRLPSPEITSDRRVTFRIAAPGAHDVTLTGEFMEGSRKLERDAAGLWSVTVGPLEPEIYHYNFTIDGVRTIDPGNPQVKTGSTFSTLASILEVRGDNLAFYDGRPVPHGDISTHWYHSKTLESLRRLTVYTPPGYDRDATTRFPVLYLFHGANADDDAWHRLGRVNFILDNLLADGKVRPFIVVMPFGYGVQPGTPNASGENTAKFGQDLLDDVLPFIESRYRTSADRSSRAIVGLSMGGGQALSIGLNRLDVFSHVAGFSAGLGAAAEFAKTYSTLVEHPEAANKKLRLLWVGCGKDDGQFNASKSFSDFLNAHKIRHTFRETSGAHTWMVWRRHLYEVAPLLFR